MTVNKERLKIAVDALRSGNYEQTQGRLCWQKADGNRQYCCLGVLTDVAIKNGLEGLYASTHDHPEGSAVKVRYLDDDGVSEWAILPRPVVEWYGFDEPSPSVRLQDDDGEVYDNELTELNDTNGMDFDEIADLIEATYLTEEN